MIMASDCLKQRFRSKTGRFISAGKAHKLSKAFGRDVDDNNNDLSNVSNPVPGPDSFLADHNYCSKLTPMDSCEVLIKSSENSKSASDCSYKSRSCVHTPDTNSLPVHTVLNATDNDGVHVNFDTGDNVDDNVYKGNTIDWREGRRIVELAVLAEGLEKGCSSCCKPLSLSCCVSERHFGLASFLYIRCSYEACGVITAIPTGKRHRSGGTAPRTSVWDVNTKLALGMIHTGLGEVSINMLLASLNIPGIDSKSLKKREREAGIKMEHVTEKSCAEFAQKEVELSENKVEVSFDAGWQKRGSGRSYNSLSGHACMIGSKTGKCISYAVRNKTCRICETATKSGTDAKAHDCRKNWDGSSKAMECHMAVGMLKNLQADGINVDTIVMDDDTTTIARARKEVKPGLRKKSDSNHAKKHFSDRLYGMQVAKKYKQLSKKTIGHLKKCFNNIVAINKGDKENLAKNMRSLTPHLFGDHSKCDSSNCGYLRNPDTYIPKNLPYRTYLKDSNLRVDLEKTCDAFAEQSDKLSNLGSSQSNESFNNTVASKAPKRQHFSSSESTSFRVSAATSQKNLGTQYVVKVNEEMLLSPGGHTREKMEKIDKKRKQDKERKMSVTFKKRRSKLKSERHVNTECQEMREGITYSSGVNLIQDIGQEDITEIPAPRIPPILQPLPDSDYTFICFDLETTGLGLSCITQIAAVNKTDVFSQYVLPSTPISESATAVTGLSTDGTTLYKDGVPVQSCDISTAHCKFLKWIEKFSNPVLVAHNALVFDSVVFINSLRKDGIDVQPYFKGFVDSLPLFKQQLPGRKSYSQQSLVHDSGKTYSAHDASADCIALQELLNFHTVSDSTLLYHSFSVAFVIQTLDFRLQKQQNLETVHQLVTDKVLSKFMAEKLASSGLSYQHMKLSFDRGGEESIRNVFSELVKGKPRVTKCKKIISAVYKHFSSTKGDNL